MLEDKIKEQLIKGLVFNNTYELLYSRGELKNFPLQIVKNMLDLQVSFQNFYNLQIFENNLNADVDKGGFNWNTTFEGYYFWENVLVNKNFDLFFNKYPIIDNKTEVYNIILIEGYLIINEFGNKFIVTKLSDDKNFGYLDLNSLITIPDINFIGRIKEIYGLPSKNLSKRCLILKMF